MSVYECEDQGGIWKVHGDAWKKNGKSRSRATDSVWLLVEGDADESVTGGDREPLAKNVKVVRVVTWDGSHDGFVDSGAISRQSRNHRGYPTCICEGGTIDFYKKLLDEREGEDDFDSDEDPDEDDDVDER